MKKTSLLITVMCALIGCGQIDNNLIVKGHIDGLQEGDTLFLTSILIPDWKEEAVDTYYVHKSGEFSLTKPLEHTTYFLLSHAPKDTARIESCILGASILAKPGDVIEVRGSIYTIGALEKKGGFYNDALVARLDSLDNAYSLNLIHIFNKAMEAQRAEQEDSIQKYQEAYNSARRPEELTELNRYIAHEINDNEYAAYLYLSHLYDVTATQSEERFENFSPEVKESYMGKRLYTMLMVLKNIEVGNTPSEFLVKDRDGNPVRLSDYRGKYLLIYNWGMCRGTLWVHPKILKLYEQYHDKGFEVLGFTANDFFNTYADLKTNADVEILFNHPWTTVVTDVPENAFIVKDYYFVGVPILMLISPDGTTVARGFTEVYNTVEKTLEENL